MALMFSNIKRLSFRHKNNKPLYYLINNIRRFIPISIYQRKLNNRLSRLSKFDADYVHLRVNYYNRLNKPVTLAGNTPTLAQLKLGKKMKTYFFDSFEFVRYFNFGLKANFLFGDITYVPEVPSFQKSRPIVGDLTNAIVLKLDKIRHFLFINDPIPFEKKKDMLLGRFKAQQAHRVKFLEMYFNHPLCNIGQVNRNPNPQFIRNRLTIHEHLSYKYILCLEGFDVASNLKWVMSSNSVAVMPVPTYETWFMEGTLIPDFHYIQIKDDFSDLEERLDYYTKHPQEAKQIVLNAHQYIEQFKNTEREDLISLMVLDKYFKQTN